MSQVVLWLAMALAAYFLGSIPTGYLLVKQLKGVDIREFGSGNTGATNVKRLAGNKAFAAVLLLDVCKGLLPVLAVKMLIPTDYWLHVLVAVMAIVGHSKSVFLKFSGGKSAATGLGTVIGLAPLPSLALCLLAFLIIKFGRIVSVGTMITALCSPILFYLIKAPEPYLVYTTVCSLYVIYLHKANISRLLNGTENRI